MSVPSVGIDKHVVIQHFIYVFHHGKKVTYVSCIGTKNEYCFVGVVGTG